MQAVGEGELSFRTQQVGKRRRSGVGGETHMVVMGVRGRGGVRGGKSRERGRMGILKRGGERL